MTPGDVARVLTKCAAYDQRTIGEADVAAWHEILAPYELGDALDAVTRHYRDSTERIMPAQLRKLTVVVRDERRRVEGCPEALALPSRYEPDPDRDGRVQTGLAQCRHVLQIVMDDLEAARLRSEQARQPRSASCGEVVPGTSSNRCVLQAGHQGFCEDERADARRAAGLDGS